MATGSGVGPPVKKLKKRRSDIFWEFREDANLMHKLRTSYIAISQGLSRMNVCVLNIKETDARCSESFTQASCKTQPYMINTRENEAVKSYTMGSIFSDGLELIRAYICEEDPKLPDDRDKRHKSAKKALKKLLIFLSKPKSHDALKCPHSETIDECDWAIRLAHLFSELAVEGNYTLENHYSKTKLQREKDVLLCPCSEKDPLVGKFGDTSFGCLDGWHGEVDILLENLLPVSILLGETDDIAEEEDNESAVEVKSSECFSLKDIKQMIVQTIVFSFLQHKQDEDKQDEDKLSNYLIPSIGICREQLIVHFYDSVNDILLGTVPLDLFAGNNLHTTAIVFLWLTLNYKMVCTGVINDMHQYKAGFFELVGEKYLEIYRHNVIRHVHKNTSQMEKFINSWANEPGAEERPTPTLACTMAL